MKFCKDCKYGESLWCSHPSNGVSPVTGRVRPQWATIMRQYAGRCDEEGLLWEPRNPKLWGELALTENQLPTKHKSWWKFWSK